MGALSRKYDEADAALLRLIKSGVKKRADLEAAMAHEPAALAVCKELRLQPWRIVDRRLRELRIRGLIAASRETWEWSVVEQEATTE